MSAREKRLTDRQVALRYVTNRLWGWCPDKGSLEDAAGGKLSEERYNRILDVMTGVLDKIRAPLLQELERGGVTGS